MMRFKQTALLCGVVAAFGLSSPPAQAQSLLEIMFPRIFKKDISDAVPADGGKMAPFQNSAPALPPDAHQGEEYKAGDAGAAPATPTAKIEYAPANDVQSVAALDQPHRQPGQMTVWISKAVADALDFDPLRYEAHLAAQGLVMTPYAMEVFKGFMAKDNLLEALKSSDMVMRAFVTDASRVLNQGAIQGRYRWLMETPVTISFMPRGVNDYSGIKPKSQRINVRTQVGRVAQGGQEGVMIETMEFLPATAP